MQTLNLLLNNHNLVGKLAVLDISQDSILYVIETIDEEKHIVMLVELDKPSNTPLQVNYAQKEVYILPVQEIIKRVTSW